MGFVRIGTKADLPEEGQVREFTADGKVLCVTRVGGSLCALDNVCPHRGGPLGQGVVLDGWVVCPWHGWQYDPRTGESRHNPGVKVTVYPLKVEGEDALVEI